MESRRRLSVDSLQIIKEKLTRVCYLLASTRKAHPYNMRALLLSGVEARHREVDLIALSAGGYPRGTNSLAIGFYRDWDNVWCRKPNKLAEAVGNGNVDEIQRLVAGGEDVTEKINTWLHERATLLHIANDVPTIDLLVDLGIPINALDSYGRTPLHSAVELNRRPEVIKAFLGHGADVDKLDFNRFSALNYAVNKFFPDHEVIKILLDHGAKIVSEEQGIYPPLFHSMNKLSVAKLLIKIHLLRNYRENSTNVIDLNPYKGYGNYPDVMEFVKNCEFEIILMKSYKINKKYNLFDLLAAKTVIGIPLSEGNKILNLVRETQSYIVYGDMIKERVHMCTERSMLMLRLLDTEIFTIVPSNTTECEEISVTLDSDSVYKIAGYLANEDLFNVLKAFDTI